MRFVSTLSGLAKARTAARAYIATLSRLWNTLVHSDLRKMSSNTTSGHVNIQSNLYIPPKDAFIPLIINGEDIKSDSTECHYKLPSSSDPTMPSEVVYQGTTPELTQIAIESAERAFTAWSQTGPALRRRLLMGLATVYISLAVVKSS